MQCTKYSNKDNWIYLCDKRLAFSDRNKLLCIIMLRREKTNSSIVLPFIGIHVMYLDFASVPQTATGLQETYSYKPTDFHKIINLAVCQ